MKVVEVKVPKARLPVCGLVWSVHEDQRYLQSQHIFQRISIFDVEFQCDGGTLVHERFQDNLKELSCWYQR